MGNTITVKADTIDYILSALEEIKREIKSLRKRLEIEPPYGSNEWWEWSDNKAMEDIKAGRYKTFKSAKELEKYLDALK